MSCTVSISVADNSSIGEARRVTLSAAKQIELNDTDAGRASLIATELATNLVRHAKSQTGVICISQSDGGLEIVSMDAGPGMKDVARCFSDGYSTGGTSGTGLGAVSRMSDEHDLYSAENGTVIWCRINANRETKSAQRPRVSCISTMYPGETACGDAWRVVYAEDNRLSLIVADGLGHGPLAAEASEAACASFARNRSGDPAAILDAIHAAIQGTRGAAVSVAVLDPATGKLVYAGVGNIAGTLIGADGSSRGLFSHNGTVGHAVRRTQNFEYPWSTGSTLVLHSDGLQTRWTLGAYFGLVKRHPGVIAGILHRDFRRGRDDATVVVVSG